MKLKILESIIGTGRFASVDFLTKTGRNRTINGRTGVVKYVTGKGRRRNLQSKGQFIVWEPLRPQDTNRDGKRRYRTITADNVRAIRADGVEIRVTK